MHESGSSRDKAARLACDGYEPVLKHARWRLPKRRENLTEKQTMKLSELFKQHLQAVRAHLLGEDFRQFWHNPSPAWADKFLDGSCNRAVRSKLNPTMKVAASLRMPRELLVNRFRARGEIYSGIVAGFRNKAKLTSRTSYGYHSTKVLEIALLHKLVALPEPNVTHELC